MRIHLTISSVWISGETPNVPIATALRFAALLLATAMAGAWALQRATRNCGWVDAVWSASTGLTAAWLALTPPPGSHSPAPRAWLAAAMAAFWGLRLALHIASRTPGAPEDPRYAAFRAEWGSSFEAKLFGLLMVQAAAALVLAAAVLLAARNPAPFPRATDACALLLLLGAVAGEAVADAQLTRFRAKRTGRICDTGLWGYSRHPNYFFEFLAWCAYPLLALNISAYPSGVFSIAAPALMFVLLRYVSGVPPLERSMLARRGAAFAAYQARVSVFFPLPSSAKPKARTP